MEVAREEEGSSPSFKEASGASASNDHQDAATAATEQGHTVISDSANEQAVLVRSPSSDEGNAAPKISARNERAPKMHIDTSITERKPSKETVVEYSPAHKAFKNVLEAKMVALKAAVVE